MYINVVIPSERLDLFEIETGKRINLFSTDPDNRCAAFYKFSPNNDLIFVWPGAYILECTSDDVNLNELLVYDLNNLEAEPIKVVSSQEIGDVHIYPQTNEDVVNILIAGGGDFVERWRILKGR